MGSPEPLVNAGCIDRTKYIGGSDIAPILGISPWRTPLDVWLDKVHPRKQIHSQGKQKIFDRGKRMEPYVTDMLAEETGLVITGRGNRYIHPDYGFIAAEIDAETEDNINIEIKTVSPFKAREWGKVQTDEIPVYYTAQAMHGLMVTGREVCILGVLIGGDDFRIYQVQRCQETIDAILAKEIEFWDSVSHLNPPPVTTVSDIISLYGNDKGTSIEADDKIIQVYNKLKALKNRKKEIKEEIAVSEEKIKFYMQDNAILTIERKPVATWKSQNSTRFSQSEFELAHPDLFKKFKKISSSRVLRLK